MIKFIEMYAGIGGFRLGIEKSNGEQQDNSETRGCGNSIGSQIQQSDKSEKRWDYTCVWSNELDKYASQIYRKHWNDGTLYEGDIRTVDPITIPEHELICAGFPCQSFSIAGTRGGFSDIRGTLFYEICRIARDKRTPYLWLENVKGLLSAPYTEAIEDWSEEDFNEDGEPTGKALRKHRSIPGTKGWVFLTILYTLWELGYDCQWEVLNSKNFGVPQNRERVFIIGHLRGYSRPKVFPIGEINQEVDESEPGISFPTVFSSQHKIARGMPMLMVNQHKMRTGEWGDGTKTMDEPSFTLDSSSGRDLTIAEKTSIRRLTPIECERLQGFPDNWTEGVSDTQRYKMLGNAVTVNVINEIANVMFNQLQCLQK